MRIHTFLTTSNVTLLSTTIISPSFVYAPTKNDQKTFFEEQQKFLQQNCAIGASAYTTKTVAKKFNQTPFKQRRNAFPSVSLPKIEYAQKECSLSLLGDVLKDKKPTLIINAANNKHAGGGAKNGAFAQEEALFRITDLSLSLYKAAKKDRQYPLGDKVIFSPNVRFVIDPSKAQGGEKFLDASIVDTHKQKRLPFSLQNDTFHVASMAAQNRQNLGPNPDYNDVYEHMRVRLKETWMYVANNGIKKVVAPIPGCGVFARTSLNGPVDGQYLEAIAYAFWDSFGGVRWTKGMPDIILPNMGQEMMQALRNAKP